MTAKRAAKPASSSPKRKGRINDPERTRADILRVAGEEFAEHGFAGGRVDEIAERTKTSKRMIYYYFESKEGLYRTVLLEYYAKLRGAEADRDLDGYPPLEALQKLIAFTFDWHTSNPDGVRLVMVENIHRARSLQTLPSIEPVNSKVIGLVQRILDRGVAEGSVRPGISAMDLYLSIASLCYFNVSNRYTVAAIFGHDMGADDVMARRRQEVTDMALRYVAAKPSASTQPTPN